MQLREQSRKLPANEAAGAPRSARFAWMDSGESQQRAAFRQACKAGTPFRVRRIARRSRKYGGKISKSPNAMRSFARNARKEASLRGLPSVETLPMALLAGPAIAIQKGFDFLRSNCPQRLRKDLLLSRDWKLRQQVASSLARRKIRCRARTACIRNLRWVAEPCIKLARNGEARSSSRSTKIYRCSVGWK